MEAGVGIEPAYTDLSSMTPPIRYANVDLSQLERLGSSRNTEYVGSDNNDGTVSRTDLLSQFAQVRPGFLGALVNVRGNVTPL